jgi:hypothetical protein
MKMQKPRLILIFAMFLLTGEAFSQEDGRRLTERTERFETEDGGKSKASSRPGKIRIHADERIARLDSLKQAYPGNIAGYRVQIFFGSKEEALKMKAEFLKEYPDVPAYISYLAPNFRLRVGDFRTRLEAEKLKSEIDDTYSGIYIVRDKIELPELKVE